MDPKFVWLDLETTGLEPKRNSILEVAAIVTDGVGEKIGAIQQVVQFFDPSPEYIHPDVMAMHTKNGLWLECASSIAHHPQEVEGFVLGWLLSHGCQQGRVHLAGNSVHFDLRFLLEQMPDLASLFHYRVLDMTSVRLWADSLNIAPPKKSETHRALQDAQESLDAFHYYRDRAAFK